MQSKNKIQLKDGEITGIIVRGFKRSLLTQRLIDENPQKNILLFSDDDTYFPCKRYTLFYQTNLLKTFIKLIDDFDLLIFDAMCDWSNSKENIELINYILTNEKCKNKQFVFYFLPNREDFSTKLSVNLFNDDYQKAIKNKLWNYFYFDKTENYNQVCLQDKNWNCVNIYNTIDYEKFKMECVSQDTNC